MSINAAVTAMRETALFRNVDEKRLKLVAMMGETLTYRPGELLFDRGDPGDAAFIVVHGAVDVILRVEGIETVVATLGEGEIFGEIAVLCDQARTTAKAPDFSGPEALTEMSKGNFTESFEKSWEVQDQAVMKEVGTIIDGPQLEAFKEYRMQMKEMQLMGMKMAEKMMQGEEE